MVKHVVMWKIKETDFGTKEENRDKFRSMLLGLKPIIPGLVTMEVGCNFLENGYDLCLYSVFQDQTSLDGYQIHPDHVKVKEFAKTIVAQRAGADYED